MTSPPPQKRRPSSIRSRTVTPWGSFDPRRRFLAPQSRVYGLPAVQNPARERASLQGRPACDRDAFLALPGRSAPQGEFLLLDDPTVNINILVTSLNKLAVLRCRANADREARVRMRLNSDFARIISGS